MAGRGLITSGVMPSLPPRIVSIPEPTLTAAIRARVELRELSKFIPAACGEVWNFARAAGLPKPGRHLALYQEHGEVEVGAEIQEPFAGNERVHCSSLPKGRAATMTHFGPYSGLGETHAAIRQWCTEQGHVLTGISWELYGHWDESWNKDASKIQTDVFYLLQD